MHLTYQEQLFQEPLFVHLRIGETIRSARHHPEKDASTMQAPCSDSTLLSASAEPEQTQIGHALYQGATVVVILLFLISFWSC